MSLCAVHETVRHVEVMDENDWRLLCAFEMLGQASEFVAVVHLHAFFLGNILVRRVKSDDWNFLFFSESAKSAFVVIIAIVFCVFFCDSAEVHNSGRILEKGAFRQ